MKAYTLKESENYPSHILFIELNSFGDQVLTIRHERLDGSMEYRTLEINHEGSWRSISRDYIEKLSREIMGEVNYEK